MQFKIVRQPEVISGVKVANASKVFSLVFNDHQVAPTPQTILLQDAELPELGELAELRVAVRPTEKNFRWV